MTHAQDERRAICAVLTELGPARPTLCQGWQTADLAAHLVLRERRPMRAPACSAARWPATPGAFSPG